MNLWLNVANVASIGWEKGCVRSSRTHRFYNIGLFNRIRNMLVMLVFLTRFPELNFYKKKKARVCQSETAPFGFVNIYIRYVLYARTHNLVSALLCNLTAVVVIQSD